MTALEDALMGPDGPVEVEKIEIELLANSRFRWLLRGAGGDLIYCAVADRGQVRDMLEASRVIAEGMLGTSVGDNTHG